MRRRSIELPPCHVDEGAPESHDQMPVSLKRSNTSTERDYPVPAHPDRRRRLANRTQPVDEHGRRNTALARRTSRLGKPWVGA